MMLGLAVMLLCSSCRDKRNVQVIGSIQNDDQTSLSIVDYFGTSEWTTDLDVQDGAFELYLPLDNPSLKRLTYGSAWKDLYLEPGQTVEITFDAQSFDSTFRFTGTLATENSLLDSVATRLQNVDYSFVYTQPLDVATAYIDSLHNDGEEYFNTLAGSHQISAPFIQSVEDFIHYNAATLKIIIGERQDEKPDDYYRFLHELTIENARALDNHHYRMFFSMYVDMETNKRLNIQNSTVDASPGSFFDEKLKVIEDLDNETVRSYSLFNAMNYYLMEHGLDDFERHYDYFTETNTDPYYDEQLRIAYEKKQRIAPGQPAPPFTLSDLDGNEVSLSDFKGQYVFLDFWQTLCSRSARELPHLLQLHSDYKEDNIAFVSISIDENKENWINYVKENKNMGTSLRSENYFDAKVYRDYQVFGLPTFILIDPEGRIVDPKAPQPSSDEIRHTLDQLLR